MKKKALIIAHDYPPCGITSSRRSGNIAKYLPQFGWEIVVVTRKWKRDNCNLDYSIVENLPPEIKIIEINYPTIPTGLGAVLTHAIRFFYPSLHPYLFFREGKILLDQVLLENKFDIIFTTLPPANSLDLACYASMKCGVPMVVDFRDVLQWCPNLFVRITMPMRLFHERRMLKQASAVTAVSEGFAHTLQQRHQRTVVTILHGYDDELLNHKIVTSSDRFIIVYTGSLVLGKPDLQPLLTAVANLIERGEMEESDISIEFYGAGNCDRLKEMFEGKKYFHLIKDCGVVPHKQLLNVQRKASILLVAAHPGKRGWITSKIYEYIAAQRPILSIPEDVDCIDKLLRETKCGNSCSSVGDIEQQLRKYYCEWKCSGVISYTCDREAIRQYTVLRQVEKLAQLFDEQVKIANKPTTPVLGELSKCPICVSVIIPVRNGIETIDRAISSVLKQVGAGEIELVVIDDGSTDGTASFISEKYPFVKLISNDGKGVSSARNTGIAHSTGRYVAFLDADDEWKSGKLAKQVEFLERNPRYILSACAAEYVDVDGRLQKIGKSKFDGVATKSLFNGNFIATSSVVLRKSILRQENLSFHEELKFAEDWQMWIRLSSRGKFKIISTPLIRYTVYSASKYDINHIVTSLQKMVDSLNADPILANTIISVRQRVDSIPALAKLSWVRRVEGRRAAAFEAIKVLRKYPTRVLRVMRTLV